MWEFLGDPVVKEPPSNARDRGSILGPATRITHVLGQLSSSPATTKPAPQLRPNAAKEINNLKKKKRGSPEFKFLLCISLCDTRQSPYPVEFQLSPTKWS